MKVLLFILFFALIATFLVMFLVKERNRGVYPGLHRAPVAERPVKVKRVRSTKVFRNLQTKLRLGKVQFKNEGRPTY